MARFAAPRVCVLAGLLVAACAHRYGPPLDSDVITLPNLAPRTIGEWRAEAAAAMSSSSGSPTSCMPLLAPGTHHGIVYSKPNDAGANATEQAYDIILGAGARTVQLGLKWPDIEPTRGTFNYQIVQALLAMTRSVDGFPLINLAVIDTNRLAVPADLVDPGNPNRIIYNMSFISQPVLERYASVMAVFAPLVAYYGGFYIGLGNEVDSYLMANPDLADDYVTFVYILRQFIVNQTSPDMAVGATLTVGGINYLSKQKPVPAWFTNIFLAADITPLTYYPLNPDFTVRASPTEIGADITNAVAQLPSSMCIVFQEWGCPAGYNNASSVDKSSVKVQASFVQEMFTLFNGLNGTEGRVRAASAFALVDMDPATCTALGPYYNNTDPGFTEYLCTLGLMYANGTAKPALVNYYAGLNT